MLCALKNMKNMCYTEKNSSLKKPVIDLQHQFYKNNQEFRNQKFNLVQLCNHFCVSLIWFDCRIQSYLINGLSLTESD